MSASDDSLFSTSDGAVVLHGVHCARCGATLFPPQHYGCERCGAHGDELVDATIAARGSLHSFSTVYLHARVPTPFQMAEVLTGPQAIVRARLDHPAAEIGAAVVAELRSEDGQEILVFVPEEET